MVPEPALVALLAEIPLFAGLGPHHLARLQPLLQPFHYTAGESLFCQGDPADQLYLIAAGVARVGAHSPGDDRVTLLEADRGAVLGEMSLNQPMNRAASVSAASELSGWKLELAGFAGLRCFRDPVALLLLRGLARSMCARLRDSIARIASQQPAAPPRRSRSGAAPSPPDPRYREVLRVLPFFKNFDANEIAVLMQSMRQWELPRGTVACVEGEPGDSCHIVIRGAVAVSTRRMERDYRLGILGPGKMFGEISMVDGSEQAATCTVREDAVLLELMRPDFEALMQNSNSLSFRFIEALNANLIAAHLRTNATLVRLATEAG